MKIAILIDRFNIGGVEKIAIEEVKAFKKIGIQTSLVVLSRKALVKNAFFDLRKDIKVIYLDDRLPSFLKFTFKIPFFYFFSFFHLSYPLIMPFFIKNNEYDFIISHGTYTSFTALTISVWKHIPYAIYIWDPISYILQKAYDNGPIEFIRRYFNFILEGVDGVLVNSAKYVFYSGDSHTHYLESIIKNKQKLKLLPLGYDYAKAISIKKEKYFITVTAWKEGKGLEQLLENFSIWEKAKLVIAGKWLHEGYKKKILAIISQNKLKDKVVITGEVSEKNLQSLYKHALSLIIVNNEKGFGMPALESAANGCTFIIPTDCGVTKYFKKDIDGFFYKYNDIVQVERYIRFLLKKPTVAGKMGKHAWQKVKNHYSWINHVEKIKSIINK